MSLPGIYAASCGCGWRGLARHVVQVAEADARAHQLVCEGGWGPVRCTVPPTHGRMVRVVGELERRLREHLDELRELADLDDAHVFASALLALEADVRDQAREVVRAVLGAAGSGRVRSEPPAAPEDPNTRKSLSDKAPRGPPGE